MVPFLRYEPPAFRFKRRPHLEIQGGRGCSCACSFCPMNSIGYRQRTAGSVLEEIRFLIGRYGVRELHFCDANFTVNREWVEEICRARPGVFPETGWTCTTRVDMVDESLLMLMKDSGCWSVLFGLESYSQELLDRSGKKTTVSLGREAVRWAKKAELEVIGTFMIGLPGETPSSVRETIEFALSLPLDFAIFSVLMGLNGNQRLEGGRMTDRISPSSLDHKGYIFIPDGFRTTGELHALQKKAYIRFYVRPKFIWERIRSIRSFEDMIRYLAGFRMPLKTLLRHLFKRR